ncbi:unnamed protein product [Lepeophtheirus salmonis]|uniref:(salmon louse) hypothetical protein n=1 Tax=Lepeophtheirus salmonis TaxID=72036 RepID=A0A7R8D6N8_LEPSM|nr:unnamed protein product [Lepeophtheirus salmonis]CAF3045942.1 unnamed protein product [Lepeophtheirus salmonis]
MDGRRKLMAKGKKVKVKESLEILHRCEAVDATVILLAPEESICLMGPVRKFEEEVTLMLASDAKLVQLPTRSVPPKYFAKAKGATTPNGGRRHNSGLSGNNKMWTPTLSPCIMGGCLTQLQPWTTLFNLSQVTGLKYWTKRVSLSRLLIHQIFCEHMDRVLQGIPGPFPCADDIKVQGSTEELHNIDLLETISRAKVASLKTDASTMGLGAVLIQKEMPVRYVSKLLSPTEMEYANIERELLAVLFACKKLHNYTFWTPIWPQQDFNACCYVWPNITWKSNTSVLRAFFLADTLSQFIPPGRDERVPGLDVTITRVLKIATTRLESIQSETEADSILLLLSKYIRIGWPTSMQAIHAELIQIHDNKNHIIRKDKSQRLNLCKCLGLT